MKLVKKYFEGQEVIILGSVFLVWFIMGLTTSTYATVDNFKSIMYSSAPIAIIGIGMTAVIVTAGIDVSVGSSLAIITVVVGQLLASGSVNTILAMLIAVGIGALLGAFNAFFISTLGIHPMIVTFGTLNIFRFIALEIFGDEQVNGIPNTFEVIGGSLDSSIFGVPNAMILAIVLGICMWLYMRHAPTGRHLYAIGCGNEAARLAGVKVKTRLYQVYIVTGILVGIAALVKIGSGGVVQQNIGVGLELQVIAAVVIGGTSILGARGTVFGTLLGAILVASLSSAVTHLLWPSEITNLFVGIFILLAVGVDLLRTMRRNRR